VGLIAKLICLWLVVTITTTTSSFASSTNVAVSATILSKNQCKFKNPSNPKNPSNRSLPFGDLDPLNATDVILERELSFVCNGKDNPVSYLIGDGATPPGAHRMQRLTPSVAYLPYTLTLESEPGPIINGDEIKLKITGTVEADDYRLAPAGDYSDEVKITILP